MYRLNTVQKNRRRRKIIWSIIGCIVVLAIAIGFIWIRSFLQPNTVISQSKSITTQVSYNNPTKAYQEDNFSISLPATWQLLPRQPGQYQSYTWQSPDRVTDGQQIVVYEDAIPFNLAVNRVLIVQSENTQLSLDGTVSDNCATFTTNNPLPNSPAAPAEWNGVNFYCDKANQERDVIGTSSTDGINTVILKNPTSGETHKFFFTYSDNSINPDYTVFYNVLESFRYY